MDQKAVQQLANELNEILSLTPANTFWINSGGSLNVVTRKIRKVARLINVQQRLSARNYHTLQRLERNEKITKK